MKSKLNIIGLKELRLLQIKYTYTFTCDNDTVYYSTSIL